MRIHHVAVTILVCLLSNAKLSAQDLSLLTEEQKEEGIGQFQPKKTKVEETKKPDKKETVVHHHHHHGNSSFWGSRDPVVLTGVGAGAIGAGTVLYTQQPWQEPNNELQLGEAWSDTQGQSAPGMLHESSDRIAQENVPLTPLKLRFTERYSVSARANTVFLRDMSTLNVPITQGIQSSRLKWNNGKGFDAAFSISPKSKSDFGFDIGILTVEASDTANVSSATLLYTDPHISFAPHPFSSFRETDFLTVDSNLLLPDSAYRTAIGIRVNHGEDLLSNRVLPNGLTHQIETTSSSYLLQASISPRLEFRFVQLESLFQIGAGAFFGEATTQLRNVVGGPNSLGDDIYVSRWKGTLFFQGRLGAVVPVSTFGKLRAGLHLVTQDQFVHAAAQMRSVDYVTPAYAMQSNSYVFGGLYAGLELYR